MAVAVHAQNTTLNYDHLPTGSSPLRQRTDSRSAALVGCTMSHKTQYSHRYSAV